MKRIYAALIATAVLVSMTTATAAPPSAFTPSESGCPFFYPAVANPPDADVGQVGPFGTSHLHLTGMGLSADADSLTVSLRVQDMKRQATPGYRWSYWQVMFAVEINGTNRWKELEIYYDALLDEFSWWVGPRNSTIALMTEVTGTVQTGPGGGVAITAPFSALDLKPGDELMLFEAEAGNFISYIYMDPPNYLDRTYPSGIYSPMWDIAGPDSFRALSCPGIVVKPRPLGDGRVRLDGGVLPAESDQKLIVEQQTPNGWEMVAEGKTGDLGRISIVAPVAPGEVTLRAIVTTRMLGDLTSSPVTITAT